MRPTFVEADDDNTEAGLQLEIAVRKTDRPDLIKNALAMGWDEEMNWQAELQSADISKIYDAMEQYTENGELMRQPFKPNQGVSCWRSHDPLSHHTQVVHVGLTRDCPRGDSARHGQELQRPDLPATGAFCRLVR